MFIYLSFSFIYEYTYTARTSSLLALPSLFPLHLCLPPGNVGIPATSYIYI